MSCTPVELVEPRVVMDLDTSIFMPESTGSVVANFVHANWCLFTIIGGKALFIYVVALRFVNVAHTNRGGRLASVAGLSSSMFYVCPSLCVELVKRFPLDIQ